MTKTQRNEMITAVMRDRVRSQAYKAWYIMQRKPTTVGSIWRVLG